MIYKGAILLLLSICVVLLFNINKRVGEYPTLTEVEKMTEDTLRDSGMVYQADSGNMNDILKNIYDNYKK